MLLWLLSFVVAVVVAVLIAGAVLAVVAAAVAASHFTVVMCLFFGWRVLSLCFHKATWQRSHMVAAERLINHSRVHMVAAERLINH